MCSSTNGYCLLRNAVSSSNLGELLTIPIKHRREVRTNQYKIYTYLEIEGTPVKVEIVREARVLLTGEVNPALGVPVLSQVDLYCQKLLANADRGLDTSVMSRDIIDLAMMLKGWGNIPEAAWDKAFTAYGNSLTGAFHKSVGMIADPLYLAKCLRSMQMESSLVDPILRTLERAAGRLPLQPAEEKEQQRRIAQVADLKSSAGAAFTFWQHADAAMKGALSPTEIDWAAVERATFEESICQNKQSPHSVIEILTAYSPGTVIKERSAVVEANIERFADMFEDASDHSTDARPSSAPGYD